MENNNQQIKNNKKKILFTILGIVVVLILVVGVTYAFFQENFIGTKEHSITTEGGLTFTFTESNEIHIDNIVPMSDDEGISNGETFNFSVAATSKKTNIIKYVVFLTIGEESTADASMLRTKLYDENGNPLLLPTSVNQMLYDDTSNYYLLYYNEFDLTGSEEAETVHNYSLKFWVDENFVETPVYETEGDKTIAIAGNNKFVFKVNVATVSNNFNVEVPNSTKLLSKTIMDQGVVSEGNGLYVSNDTNDENPTYYYRGNVENNYIELGEGHLGVCQYEGKVVIDYNSLSYTNKNACLSASAGLCDMSSSGLPVYYSGIPAGACTSSGNAYVNGVPEWTDQVCSYRGNPIGKITFTPTGLDVSILSEQECPLVTEVCHMELGYVTGLTESDCGSPLIQFEEPAVFGQSTYPLLWRVMRINEDETIRLILENGFSQTFNPNDDTYENAYYSNTNVENGMMWALNNWYRESLTNHDNQIATSTYCEQAKVYEYATTFGSVNMVDIDQYTPTFKCEPDANGYGLVTGQKIGLASIDELMYSGCFSDSDCNSYIAGTRTMSPYDGLNVWYGGYNNGLGNSDIADSGYKVSPVISLNSDVRVTGLGTSTSPWVLQK